MNADPGQGQMWTEKHRPRKVEEMVGNEDSRAMFLRWLREWTPGARPALLLGPPGTGKTTLVHAAAGELGYEVLELNASDYRTKDALERRLKPAMGGVTVLGSPVLIFLDEVDGLYSRADYGGAEYLLELVSSTKVPLAMAANWDDASHMPELEKASLVIRFRRVPARLVELYLRHLLRLEGLSLSDDVLRAAVRYSRGDVRAAVNSLEAAAYAGSIGSGYRDLRLTLRDAITAAAYSRSAEAAYARLRQADAQPADKIRAAYASLAMSSLGNADPERAARAFRHLSDADVLYGRIIRTRNWGLLRYLDYALAQALAGTFVAYSEYDSPYDISSRAWSEGRVLGKLIPQLAHSLHMSSGEFAAFALDAFVLWASGNEALVGRLAQIIGEDPESLMRAIESERARLLGEEAGARQRAGAADRGEAGRRAARRGSRREGRSGRAASGAGVRRRRRGSGASRTDDSFLAIPSRYSHLCLPPSTTTDPPTIT